MFRQSVFGRVAGYEDVNPVISIVLEAPRKSCCHCCQRPLDGRFASVSMMAAIALAWRVTQSGPPTKICQA